MPSHRSCANLILNVPIWLRLHWIKLQVFMHPWSSFGMTPVALTKIGLGTIFLSSPGFRTYFSKFSPFLSVKLLIRNLARRRSIFSVLQNSIWLSVSMQISVCYTGSYPMQSDSFVLKSSLRCVPVVQIILLYHDRRYDQIFKVW